MQMEISEADGQGASVPFDNTHFGLFVPEHHDIGHSTLNNPIRRLHPSSILQDRIEGGAIRGGGERIARGTVREGWGG